jgi:transposase
MRFFLAAAYHYVQLNPAPTSSSRKSAMIDWLTDRGIPFSDRICKPELYSLIKLRKPRFKAFKINAVLAEHGHSALHLPPHHPDLNPTELIWASIKEYVARKNVSLRLGKVKYRYKGRMELEMQQCPSVRTKLLVDGTYYCN